MTETTPALPEEVPHEQEHAPRRRTRKLLLDDGEGDFRVFLVHPGGQAFTVPGQPELPKGTLIPLTQYPGFTNSTVAQRYIKNRASQHSEQLSGQVIAVVKFSQIIRLELAQAIQVTMARKPKRSAPATTLDTEPPAE